MPRTTFVRSLITLAIGLGVAAIVQGYRARATASADQQVCANQTKPPPARIPADLATADPAASVYDPVAMLQNKVAPGYQIFEREQAQDPWASEMQAQLGQMLKQSLAAYPDAAIERLQCRRSTCRMLMSVERRHGKVATLAVQQPPVAPAFSLGQSRIEGERFHQEGYFLFRPDTREPAAHRRWRDKVQAQWKTRWGTAADGTSVPR
jgi:hypothetical protein